MFEKLFIPDKKVRKRLRVRTKSSKNSNIEEKKDVSKCERLKAIGRMNWGIHERCYENFKIDLRAI